MPSRYYSNAAVPTSLSSAITNVATNITVASKTGYPTVFPFTITIEKNVQGQGEAVEVTGNGTNASTDFTVVRGVDGTTAVAHGAGSLVSHDHTARDYNEWQEVRDHQIMNPGAPCPGTRRSTTVVLTTTATTVLTVPAGRKYVVKSATAAHGGTGTAIQPQLYVPFAFYLFYNSVLVPASESETLDFAHVLNAGESLQAQSNVATTGTLQVTYVDLPAADSPVRMAQSAGGAGGAGAISAANTWTTVYTAPGPMLITQATFLNGGATLSYGYRIGTAVGGQIVSSRVLVSGEQHNWDVPVYMGAGEVLQLQNTVANGLAYVISGIPTS